MFGIRILSALTLFACLAAVGSMDFKDEQKLADHYSEMVCQGFWPDYEQRQPDCSQLGIEAKRQKTNDSRFSVSSYSF